MANIKVKTRHKWENVLNFRRCIKCGCREYTRFNAAPSYFKDGINYRRKPNCLPESK